MIRKLFYTLSLLYCLSLFSQTKKQIDDISNLKMTYIQSHLKTTIPLLRKNTEDAKRTKNLKAEAKSAALLALALYYGGDYDENIRYSIRAIHIFEKLNDLENLANVYGEMGFRLKATNLRDAEKYMAKGLAIAENNHYKKPLLSIYNNYGVIKNMMKQKDSALLFYQKGLRVKQELNDSVGIPYSLNNIGEIYLEQKNYASAKKQFGKAMQYRQALKDQYGIADNLAYSGDLYFAQRDFPKAIENYEKSAEIAERLKITNLLRHDYNMLSQSHEANSNLSTALEYYKKNQKLKDSIINKETYEKMAELQLKFDSAQKEKQILEQKNLEKKRINTIKILAILFVSFIIIAFLLYRTLHLRNKQQKQEYKLKSAIAKIESQNKLQEQRLSISRDLHDNIGAQLTFIISSIETLKQAFSITDENINRRLSSISAFTKETITELRDTIWAMNHAEIDLSDIRGRILNMIDKTKISHQKLNFLFEMETDLDQVKFSSTKGMNIFRIIQEAVNNTLKYADASTLEISAKKQNSIIEITIQDDGKGFHPHTTSLGNGLRNMQKRATESDITFSINAAPDKGTTITLAIA